MQGEFSDETKQLYDEMQEALIRDHKAIVNN